MTAPTRRQIMAGSIAVAGAAAAAPALADEAEPYTPPTEEDWRRLFVAMRKLTPAQLRAKLAQAEELFAEDGQP